MAQEIILYLFDDSREGETTEENECILEIQPLRADHSGRVV
jgi:hypothetical protein